MNSEKPPTEAEGSVKRVGRSFFLVGLLSLLWLLLRTGTKPTRAAYPCQRTAASISYLWLTTFIIPALSSVLEKISAAVSRIGGRKIIIIGLVMVLAGSTLSWYVYESIKPKEVREGLRLSLEGWIAEAHPSSSIFVVVGTSGNDGGFARLIRLMGEKGLPFYKSPRKGMTQGPNGLIARDDVVIVKVNSQWNERGGTNTDLLKEIIEAIVNHPDGFVGEIVVADNGQAQYGSAGFGGSLDWRRNNAEDISQSVQKVVGLFSGSHKVSTYLWDKITTNRVEEYREGDMEDGYIVNETVNPRTGIAVSYPKFRTKYGTYISFKFGIWNPKTKTYDSNRLKILNVPVLKSHFIYGVTACVKHYMGVVSDKLSRHFNGRAHSAVGRGGMGTQMAETRPPTLNIIDAIWVNPVPKGYPGAGPSTSYKTAVRVNIIAASTDPVALDYWASKYILLQVAKLLGYKDAESLNPDNVKNGSFGYWLKLSMEELRRAGYWATMDESRMNVYVVSIKSQA